MTRAISCRFCGSLDVPPPRVAQSDYACRPCASVQARKRRLRRGIARAADPALPGEEWRPIPRFPGYEASSCGRVRNRLGWVMQERPPGRAPYPSVGIKPPRGKKTAVAVHRLVGEAFLGPKPEGLVTRHLNGNTSDNRPWLNLVYGTQQENCADTARHGRLPRGEAHTAAILTEAAVHEARRLRADGMSSAAIANRFGVNPRTIRDAVSGRTWAHLSPEARDAA